MLFCWLLIPTLLLGQTPAHPTKSPEGLFQLGARSTLSLFGHHGWNHQGAGMGGQFRIRLNERVNTEWFADYIYSNIDDLAGRADYHIGWSVLFYPFPVPEGRKALLQPYVQAGHCFDYTKVTAVKEPSLQVSRWSSAIQAGVGSHILLTRSFDVSASVQYMIHLGGDIDAHAHEGHLELSHHHGVDLEGHLLWTISANYTIADLW